MIFEKSQKLNELASNEKKLHEKEAKNEEIRKNLEVQKQKFKKSSIVAGENIDEELKNSTVSGQTTSPNTQTQQ